jgi:hypothetical protein
LARAAMKHREVHSYHKRVQRNALSSTELLHLQIREGRRANPGRAPAHAIPSAMAAPTEKPGVPIHAAEVAPCPLRHAPRRRPLHSHRHARARADGIHPIIPGRSVRAECGNEPFPLSASAAVACRADGNRRASKSNSTTHSAATQLTPARTHAQPHTAAHAHARRAGR